MARPTMPICRTMWEITWYIQLVISGKLRLIVFSWGVCLTLESKICSFFMSCNLMARTPQNWKALNYEVFPNLSVSQMLQRIIGLFWAVRWAFWVAWKSNICNFGTICTPIAVLHNTFTSSKLDFCLFLLVLMAGKIVFRVTRVLAVNNG